MEEALPSARSSVHEVHAPCAVVSVSTSARLHFGFLDPSGRGQRPFGSFGLALDRPRTTLTLRRAPEFKITGVECARAESYLRSVAASFGGGSAYHLHLDEVIPSHAGLGSGTQLALAIGAGVAALEGVPPDLAEIAARLDRGKRSGIGIGTFAQGGAVLDGGPGAGMLPPVLCRVPFPRLGTFAQGGAVLDGGPGVGMLPPVLCRVPFPRQWRVLLIFDPASTGMHGANETAAFADLPDFPDALTADLCRRILLGAMPALAESDFKTFCDQIGYLQRCMGAYFGPLQGGAYVSAGVAQVLDWLAGEGVSGIGQSSWGPTGFAFAASEAEGQALLAEARARGGRSALRFELAQGRNAPATIETP